MVVQIKGVWVRVLEPGLIQVQSFSNPEKWYVVDRFAKTCSCPDFRFRGRKCKHIQFVEENEWQVEIEEKIWKANREFGEWRRGLIAERLRGFKPLDAETRKRLQAAGWEYDEELSKIIYILYAP